MIKYNFCGRHLLLKEIVFEDIQQLHPVTAMLLVLVVNAACHTTIRPMVVEKLGIIWRYPSNTLNGSQNRTVVPINSTICTAYYATTFFLMLPDKTLIETKHHQHLQYLCRCCGSAIETSARKYSKLLFAKEIQQLHGTDIKNEDPDIFPPNVCSADASVLYRCREAWKKKEPYSTSRGMATFVAHEENSSCSVCTDGQTKYKRQKTTHEKDTKGKGPGRGKRESRIFNPQVPAQDESSASDTTDSPSLHDVYRKIPADEREDALDEFVDRLFHKEKMAVLSRIFQAEQSAINHDISSILTGFGTIDDLADLNIISYLEKRNGIVITTLENITQTDLRSDPLRAAVVLETLYKLKHSKFVGPVSSMLNMTLLQLSSWRPRLHG